MADGKIDIELNIDDSKANAQAESKAKKTGDAIGKGIDSAAKDGAKNTGSKIGEDIDKGALSKTQDTGKTIAQRIGGGLQGISTFSATAASKLTEIEGATKKVGDGLTKYITVPFTAAAAAIGGITLAKGWDRLTAIDTAKAKLEALGNSAGDIESIMDSALKSVRGTAFGLGDAATAAGAAVAAGVKTGDDLTRYLGLVGDAAAIAGTEFNDMGSIFGKIMTNGKATMMELGMLADAGIPIYQWLADEMGVTAEEAAKMASAGQISSEQFLAAVEKNIGGAAKIMGAKSITAAIDNIGASFARIGANFLDAGGTGAGFFGQIKPLLADFSTWLEIIEDKAKNWGEAFGTAVSTIVGRFDELFMAFKGVDEGFTASIGDINIQDVANAVNDFIDRLITGFNSANDFLGIFGTNLFELAPKILGIGVAAGPVLKILSVGFGVASTAAELLSKTTGSASKKLLEESAAATVSAGSNTAAAAAATTNATATKKLGTNAGTTTAKITAMSGAQKAAMLGALGLIGVFIALAVYMNQTGKSADEVAAMITGMAEKAAAAITGFAEALPGIINAILPVIVNLITSIAGMLPTIIPPLVEGFISAFSAIVSAIPQILPPLIQAFVGIITALVGVLPTLIPALLEAAVTLFMAIVEAIPTIIDALVTAVPQIITALVEGLTTALPALIDGFIQLFTAVAEALPTIIETLVAVIPDLITALVETLVTLIPVLIEGFIQLFMAFIQALPQIIEAIVTALPQLIEAIINALITALPLLIQGFIQLFMAFIQALPTIISSIVGAIPQILSAIINALAPLAGQLFNTAVQAFSEFISGIGSKISSIGSEVMKIGTTIMDELGKIPGKVVSIGGDIIRGLVQGVSDMVGWAVGQITSFGDSILGGLKSFFGIASPSRLMRFEVGQDVARGVVVGFEDIDPMLQINKQLKTSYDDLNIQAKTIGNSDLNGAAIVQYNTNIDGLAKYTDLNIITTIRSFLNQLEAIEAI